MKRISKIVSDLDLSSLDRFIGMSCSAINTELELGVELSSKSFARSIISKMIEKTGTSIDSQKYDYKMIRVDQLGYAKNPSPFKVTDYYKILNEEWETSEFKQLLKLTYIFFVVTHGSPETSIFKGYVIHDFTDEEMDSAKIVWLDTQDKIRNGIYDRFLTDKDTGTFFFKIHAASVTSQTSVPGGGNEPFRSFWISRKLISSIVSHVC